MRRAATAPDSRPGDAEPVARYSDLALYRRLLGMARPCWPHIAGLFVLGLLATPLSLLAPVPLKIAVDHVVGSRPLPGVLRAVLPEAVRRSDLAVLALVAALLVAIALLSQLQALSSTVLHAYAGERTVLGFRARLFRHAQRLSLQYHDTKGTADSIYRIQYDTPSIQWIAIDGVTPFVNSGVKLVAMFVVTALIDWQLALVAFAISPLLFVLSRTYRTRMRRRYREVKQIESETLGVVQEVLTAVRVVKAFGREEGEQERFLRHSRRGMRAKVRVAFAEGLLGLLINLTTAVGTASVLYLGIRKVNTGALTLGELLMVMTYLTQLFGPLQTISTMLAGMQSSLSSAHRAFEMLDELPEVAERPHARPCVRSKGAVEFRGVSFAYDGENPVLRDVSFAVAPGRRCGIAGRTGAGKTTLVSLITRFYDPTGGAIFLDGVDLRDYRLADLRNQFAIVLQEPVLFSTTIAENIAYARPDATEEEIVATAKAANAHDFIVNLPQGYETRVGERGMRLSGGERQRISLARAFLKDAPILILDEPTSSVDVRTERAIM